MQKKFPEFKTDADAEAFLDTADPSEYDFSDIVPALFEPSRKDKSISLRLPERQLDEVRAAAQLGDVPYQRFIRMAIERAFQEGKNTRARPPREAAAPIGNVAP